MRGPRGFEKLTMSAQLVTMPFVPESCRAVVLMPEASVHRNAALLPSPAPPYSCEFLNRGEPFPATAELFSEPLWWWRWSTRTITRSFHHAGASDDALAWNSSCD